MGLTEAVEKSFIVEWREKLIMVMEGELERIGGEGKWS